MEPVPDRGIIFVIPRMYASSAGYTVLGVVHSLRLFNTRVVRAMVRNRQEYEKQKDPRGG